VTSKPIYLDADNDLDRLLNGMPTEEIARKNAEKEKRDARMAPHTPSVFYGPTTLVFYEEKCEACASVQHHYAYAYRNQVDAQGVILPNSVVDSNATPVPGAKHPKETLLTTTPICWKCAK